MNEIKPAPPVVLTDEERELILDAIWKAELKLEQESNPWVDEVPNYRMVGLNVILAWFEENGIVLTREARP